MLDDAATDSPTQKYLAVRLALAATCIFGRMSFVAAASAFENSQPSTFQQLASLWEFLFWTTPALLIGTTLTRRLVPAAACVSLIGGSALLALEYRSFMQVNAMFVDGPTHWAMGLQLAAHMARAIIIGVVVSILYQQLVRRLARRR